ncbi:MAG TPA: class I SAM-dependent methyltransferase, partial [Saprospiraceae bacterium]|nr:class I SAM-dependent methyltransferase [Saprospiraceae bacterium]
NLRGNIDYYAGDVLSLSRSEGLRGRKYDVVLSTRCLINLSNFDEQKIGILEMRKMLKPNGRLILVENIKEGLDNLNAVRATFGLDPMQQRWHNHYIPQPELMKFLESMKGHMLTQEYVENIGNMYYIASRVIYAKLCKDQGVEPDYNNPINEIASQLPTFGEFYACSPNFMIVLKNENETGKSLS